MGIVKAILAALGKALVNVGTAIAGPWLVVYVARKLAQRSDNKIDDAIVDLLEAGLNGVPADEIRKLARRAGDQAFDSWG